MGSARSLTGVAIPGVILRFLERASIAYAATRDADLAPHFHWVSGWMSEPDPQLLAFFVAEPFRARLLESRVAEPFERDPMTAPEARRVGRAHPDGDPSET